MASALEEVHAQGAGLLSLEPRARRWGAADAVVLSAALVLLGGAAVLVGWAFGVRVLKSVAPGYITMKANTACGLMLLAGGLLAEQTWRGRRWVRALGMACSAVAAGIAVLTLIEYLHGVDLHIDELLVRDPDGAGGHFPPGRLAPVTALCFALLAAAHFFQARTSRRALLVAQVLDLAAFLAAFQAIVGYASGITYSFGSAFYTQIALHTAALLCLLATGQLLLRPREGLMGVLSAPTEGGTTSRKLIASAMLVPPLVNWLQLQGQRLGLYDADFGVLLRVIGNSVFFTVIVWRNALALHRVDLRRRELLLRQKELLDAEQEARRRAEATLQVREEFLSVASHELNTPLTPLVLQLQSLAQHLEAAADPQRREKAAHKLEVALRQTERLRTLVTSLLDTSQLASRPARLSREPLELGALAAEVASRFREHARSVGSELSVERRGEARGAWDRSRLEQVIANLIANAIKYGAGQPIEVEVGRGTLGARLSVRDGGIGIAASDQERIFERFERAVSSNSYGGLGLGLFIARELVAAHDGTLAVSSAPGRGSTFVVELPLSEAALEGPPPAGAALVRGTHGA